MADLTQVLEPLKASLARAPELSYATVIQYSAEVAGSAEVSARLEYNYKDEVYMDLSERRPQDSAGLMNLILRYDSGNNWYAFLNGRNLTEFYVTLLILTPATLWAVDVLPAHPKPASQALEGQTSYAEAAGWRNPAAIIALLALLMYSAYVYPKYNFADRIGDAIGMMPEHIGFVLPATTPLGLVGSLIASASGNRFGSVMPIVVSAALTTVGLLVFAIWTDELGYWVSIGIMSFVWNFAQPFLAATVGRADVDGRFVFLTGPASEGGRLLTTSVFAGVLGVIGPAGPALLGALLMSAAIMPLE